MSKQRYIRCDLDLDLDVTLTCVDACVAGSHSVWSFIQPTYVLLFSFLRCQLTVTVTLMTVVVTKVSTSSQ